MKKFTPTSPRTFPALIVFTQDPGNERLFHLLAVIYLTLLFREHFLFLLLFLRHIIVVPLGELLPFSSLSTALIVRPIFAALFSLFLFFTFLFLLFTSIVRLSVSLLLFFIIVVVYFAIALFNRCLFSVGNLFFLDRWF